MQIDALILMLIIGLPFGAAVLLLFLPRRLKWAAEIITLLVSGAGLAASLRFFLLNTEIKFSIPLFSLGSFDFAFDLAAGSLNFFLLLFASGFAFLTALYSFRFMASGEKRKEYYIFLLTALGGTAGALLANHLVVFLLFWETVSVSLYFLITTGGKESREGATKTLATLGAADGCLLLGLGLLWYLTRKLSWNAVAVTVDNWLAIACFLLLLIGAAAKAGAMPLHSWLPKAADRSPASVMALLPASIDKLLGIYLLFILCGRVFTLTPGLQLTLMIMGGVTIVAAVMMALVQHTLPRLLSYHAISQVGYMVLGIGTGIPLAVAGALFHMLNNAVYKNCLFLCAGAVEYKTGTTELADLGGLAKAMPLTFFSFLIAALSISGVPLFNGFVSKWMIYQGLIAGQNPALFVFLIAAMFGSALTLASFIKVTYSVFLGRTSALTQKVKGDAGLSMLIPMLFLALLCVLFGIWYALPLDKFIYPALRTVYPAAPAAFSPTGTWDSLLALLLAAGSVLFGILIYAVGRLVKKSRSAETFVGGEVLESESARVPGTLFYDSIEALKPLRAIYKTQARGALDPYNWAGKAGLVFSGFLKKLHNGLLPLYLLWSVAGLGVLLALFALRIFR